MFCRLDVTDLVLFRCVNTFSTKLAIVEHCSSFRREFWDITGEIHKHFGLLNLLRCQTAANTECSSVLHKEINHESNQSQGKVGWRTE
jgi:hypothetical protein